MNKIYKLSLLSYFFLLGCSYHTPDLMAAYVYACDLERAKHRIEQGSIDDFNVRFKQLCDDNSELKKKLEDKNQQNKTITAFEEQILNGNIEKRFKEFETFIADAFKNVDKNYIVNSAIRDFAAYASLSQSIFNILMYAFAGLGDNKKASEVLYDICKLLRFLEPVTVIKILVQCEEFYQKESYSNFQQELIDLYNNITKTIQDANVNIGSIGELSSLNFSDKEIKQLFGTLAFLLSNKNFFNTSEENTLQGVLSSYKN